MRIKDFRWGILHQNSVHSRISRLSGSEKKRHRRSRFRRLVGELLESRTMLAGQLFQVNTFETWNANPRVINSTDPAGIGYHAPSGHLFLVDSEIDEMSRYFVKKNVFEVSAKGDAVFGETWPGKEREPTGIVWNEADGFFYITNDDAKTLTRYDSTLTTALKKVSTSSSGVGDPEDVTADPSGNLYVVSGHPPLVGVFDSNLKFIRKFATSTEMTDAEGIAYSKENSHLYLVSAKDRGIFEYTLDGVFVEKYSVDVLQPKPQTPQGLVFAPCTDMNTSQCLFIADGGVDNKPDGRVYEVRFKLPKLPPIADGQSVSLDEDKSVAITLTGSDPNNDPLTFAITNGPVNGVLTGTAPNVTYKPNANFNGTDRFQFKTKDGTADSPIATVSITVNAVNDAPVAQAVSVTTTKGVAVATKLNGSDVDGDPITYSIVSGPSSGNLAGVAPNLVYTPTSSFVGTATFTYKVSDATSSSSTATVSIHVGVTPGPAPGPVDPANLVFQDGVLPTPSYKGTQDTKLRSDNATKNYGTADTLEMDGNPDFTSLVKWDLNGIPSGTVVQSASITIKVVKTSLDVFNLYEVLRPWGETSATFRLATSGVSWQTPGAQGASDRGSTVLGTVTGPNLGSVTIQLNAAGIAVVQNWINNPAQNYGIVFQNFVDASTDDLDFSSREDKTALYRPKLSIVSVPAAPVAEGELAAASPETLAAAVPIWSIGTTGSSILQTTSVASASSTSYILRVADPGLPVPTSPSPVLRVDPFGIGDEHQVWDNPVHRPTEPPWEVWIEVDDITGLDEDILMSIVAGPDQAHLNQHGLTVR